jgi:holo-[acyl-carrier protein] synthase
VIAGIGVDIVDVARMEAALRRTPSLANRLFTERERAGLTEVPVSARSVASLAGSFAAKEALAKVLGAPPGLHWTDAEVVREPSGRPSLRVRGTVAAAAARQGIAGWHLSMSHDGGMCVAVVVGERDVDPAEPDDVAEAADRAESSGRAEAPERARRAAR